jgi:hypothetical protein
MRYAIIDLDGSISDCSWRVLYATDARMERDPEKKAKLWDDFHSRCGLDAPHAAEVEIVKAWIRAGHLVIFLTGRSAKFRGITQHWLTLRGLPVAPLFMRDSGDFSRSSEYKLNLIKIIEAEVLKPGDTIDWILEDNQHCVDMWRANGYTCLQPRAGAF